MLESKKDLFYTPIFKKLYKNLLEIYKKALTDKENKPENIARCQAALTMLVCIKETGVLPPVFTNNFWKDIEQIMKEVHAEIGRTNLTSEQSMLSFGMANLRIIFGGK